jgi:hypothetical protein
VKLDAVARHAVLDSIVASYLEANPTKLPSTTTVLELGEWHYQTVVGASVDHTRVGAVQCARCGQYLSTTRVEMRLALCSNCDRSHRRR